MSMVFNGKMSYPLNHLKFQIVALHNTAHKINKTLVILRAMTNVSSSETLHYKCLLGQIYNMPYNANIIDFANRFYQHI